MQGVTCELADGSLMRVRTIPFTQEGFEIALMLDELSQEGIGNTALMKRMLQVCLAGLRLNYPALTERELAAKLDIQSASRIINALRGEEEQL